jgi:hypothetical protein
MTKISNQYSLTNVLFADTTNGRVGVNNVSPTVALDVTGAARISGGSAISTAVFSLTGNDGGIDINNTGTLASGRTSQVRLVNGTTFFGANDRSYQLINIGTSSTATDFYIQYFNGSSYFDRFRITSAGNVGIGTSSPTYKLEVNSGSSDYLGYRIFGSGHAYLLLESTTSARQAIIEFKSPTRTYSAGLDTDGSWRVSDSTAGAERMRITSAGNVGIGVVPKNWLSSVKVIQFSVGGSLWGIGASNNIFSANEYLDSAGTSRYISTDNASRYQQNAGNHVWFTAASGSADSAITFNERMRITSGGNVGIGTTSPDVRLQIDGTNNQERLRLRNTDSVSYLSFSEQNITMWRPNDSGSALVLQTQAISGTWTGGGGGIEFRPLNTLRMTIGPTGNIGAPSGTNIYNASDARLKQNISQITYGLDAIAALNPVKFNWIDEFEPSEDGKDMLGFVAQEVLEVLPEAVELFGNDIVLNGETITTPLRVNEKFIIPVLVKAIQELSADLTSAKQEIELLKAKA